MWPTFFELFGIGVPSFGVMFALAVVVGIWLTLEAIERRGGDPGKALTVLMLATVSGYVGARLWWVGEALIRGTSSGVGFFGMFANSGLTWYGGFAVGLAVALGAGQASGIPAPALSNALAPGLAVAQAIGRIGCFLVGDDYGRPTDAWLGIAFPEGSPPISFPVHPTQLYEMAWLFLVGGWLWRRRNTSRSLFAEYLILAGCGRFGVEFFRGNPAFLGPLTNAQTVALLSVTAGTIWTIHRSRQAPKEPAAA